MGNWYTTLEAVKRSLDSSGIVRDSVLGDYIEAATAEIEADFGRIFIPKHQTRHYRWPQRDAIRFYVLTLDADLISVDTNGLTSESGDTTISADDFILMPDNTGPPYHWIEIDLSSTAEFKSKNTAQQAIAVAGLWGYGQDTETGGTLTAAISSTTATSCTVSNAALIGVGDTILIDSEQLFVSAKSTKDVGKDTNGALTADVSDVTVTMEASHGVNAGEVILVNSERMYVEDVTGNDLTVQRSFDGTVLAAHDDDQDVYAYRTLTVVRGVNGTTAATHDNAKAISVYKPPADIRQLCLALAVARDKQTLSGWTGVIGGADASIETKLAALEKLRQDAKRRYRRIAVGAV